MSSTESTIEAAATTTTTASTEVAHTEENTGVEETPQIPQEAVYSCRVCRSVLFRANHIQPHEIGKHGFASHRITKDIAAGIRGSGAAAATAAGVSGGGEEGMIGGIIPEDISTAISSTSCTSFFLQEALKWMASVSGDVEGKLCCYHCNARVGSLKWAGTQCSCGTWVTPAIQMSKKALDLRFVPLTQG